MWQQLGLRFDTVVLLFNGGGWWGMGQGTGHVCRRASASICSASSFTNLGILIYHETLHALGLPEWEMGNDVIKMNFNKLIDRNAFPCLYNRVAKGFKKV